ncbi:hypothetical protein SCLCIDRAFT_29284 [Scleroderma citrinum Foug A]|uniref:Myb/SANT-like domain-containing protein n=1 Tax=Scleroderma citrinum Foug A TaxID=1036808 RepID=A0A0C3DLB1_9AGAM|nr:hypothetical protein SCLCIDRAFT_29284 [Scleroderma citrinum Foug A]
MNWPPNEVLTLVHYLHKHHERIGDGGNFRQDIYAAAAAAHLNMIHPNPTHPKTADAVKNGYVKEHPLIHHFKSSGWEFYTFLQDILENDTHAQGESTYAPANVNTAMGSVDCTGGTDGASKGNQVNEEMPSTSVSTAAPSLPSVPPLPLDGASSKGKECKVEPPPDMSLPSPPSSSKCSYTEMASDSTEDYNTSNISEPPFSGSLMSCTSSFAKCMNLSSAMSLSRSRPASRRGTSSAMQESLMLGMQGSLNLLCHDHAQPPPRPSHNSDPSLATPKLIAVPQLNPGHYVNLQPRTSSLDETPNLVRPLLDPQLYYSSILDATPIPGPGLPHTFFLARSPV